MTELELVKDTIKFYHGHPERRSISTADRCVYFGPNNTNCAVGRWIDRDKLSNLGITEDSLDGLSLTARALNEYIDDYKHGEGLSSILKDEVKDIPINSWREIQYYHDIILTGSSSSIAEHERELIRKYSN